MEAECYPYNREEACSLVIGLFRSQEGAPSSKEETHVLSRCLLLAETRLQRDETSSVCAYKSVCVFSSVLDKGVPVHPGVPCPVEVDNTWLVQTVVSKFLSLL